MPRHRGVRWEPWSYCDRCGFPYPLGQLIVQKGLRVCTKHCIDKLDIEYRPQVIEEVLSHGEEEFLPLTPELYAHDDEEVTF